MEKLGPLCLKEWPVALVTRLSRQSRPSPRWEPLPAYSSLEERPWHGNGPLCLVRRGLPPRGRAARPWAAQAGTSPTLPTLASAPGAAHSLLHHPSPSGNQRQSHPAWTPTPEASTHLLPGSTPFLPCEAPVVTVLSGWKAPKLPWPGSSSGLGGSFDSPWFILNG